MDRVSSGLLYVLAYAFVGAGWTETRNNALSVAIVPAKLVVWNFASGKSLIKNILRISEEP